MKKTKIEQRLNNAFNIFFENDEETARGNSLSFANGSILPAQKTDKTFSENGERLIKILKRTFLFLPGAFYLFFGTFTVLEFEFFRARPFGILMMFAIGSLMTVFGIGSLKNPKHLAIPLSIVAVAIAAFAVFSTLGNPKFVFEYGIYFFPFALIASVLAKNLADDKK